MPDIKRWHLSHSDLRLRFEQLCLEYIAYALSKHPAIKQSNWFSNEQEQVLKKLIENEFQKRWGKEINTLAIPDSLAPEALENTLVRFASHLKSTIGFGTPEPEMSGYSEAVEELWSVKVNPNKPPTHFGEETWKRFIEYMIHWAYVDFLLWLSHGIVEEKKTDFVDTIQQILQGAIESASQKVLTRRGSEQLSARDPDDPKIQEIKRVLEEAEVKHWDSIQEFSSLLFKLYKISTDGRKIFSIAKTDPGRIVGDIDHSFQTWIYQYRKGWNDIDDIVPYFSSDRFFNTLETMFIERIIGTPPGFRMLFPIDLKFNDDGEELDPGPFGFSLVEDPTTAGLPSGQNNHNRNMGTSHWAVVDILNAFSPEDACKEALKRIENWLSYLTFCTRDNFYYKLVDYNYHYQNISSKGWVNYGSTPIMPYIRIPKKDYDSVVNNYAVLLKDRRDIARKTLRAIRFLHRAIHSREPDVQFINFWLTLESLTGKNYRKGNREKRNGWSFTLPNFISAFQLPSVWDSIRPLPDGQKVERREELAQEVVEKIDYLQALRSRYFLHPISVEWNEDVLQEALKLMKEYAHHAISSVLMLLDEFPDANSFDDLATGAEKHWTGT